VRRSNGKAAEPIFILAPIGSKGSLLAAALGRHPALFATPHLNLLAFENPRQFLRFARIPRDIHIHGLARLVSWMLVSEQSLEGTQAAQRWLMRRGGMESRALHQLIAAWAHPRRLVEYSPLYVYHSRVLERLIATVPDATFIHLVRHPTTTAMEIARAAAQTLNAAITHWTEHDPNTPSLDLLQLTDTTVDWQTDPPVFDPQFLWYRTHTSIASALAAVPGEQVLGYA
jgi:hypothetical protein